MRLKTLLSRPAALREIELDSMGQVQSMAKLDMDKMPTTGYFSSIFLLLISLKSEFLNY